jgi:hypothetical protein
MLRVARLDAEKYHFVDDPEPLIDALRHCGTRIDLFTFLQRLPETTPKYRYPFEWDNLAVLPISTFDHWWTKQIGFKARNKAKQGEKKGLTLREVPFDERLVKDIWEIYNECPIRQGKPFKYYGKDIDTVRKIEATYLDTSVFIEALLEDKAIGFIKLVWDETRAQAGLMNIVSMVQHRDKAPSNAMVVQAVKSCANRGIQYLVYSNFAYGKKKKDSLSDFKERNGFKQVDLPRYYVPLTDFGWAVFNMGLHRKLTDHIPEPVMARLREMRNDWYARKFQVASEAS